MNALFSLRNYTIRARMIGAIAMVLARRLRVGAAGLIGLRHVDRISVDLVAQVHAQTVTLATLRTAAGNVRRYEQDLRIHCDSATEVAACRTKWLGAVGETRQATVALSPSTNADAAAAARRIDALVQQYASAATPVFKRIEVGGFNDAPVANQAINPAINPARKFVHEAEDQIKVLQQALDRQALDSAKAQNAATGGEDETAQLLAALGAMQSALHGIVGQARGFAVVASEVRSLAQRSAEAAREIRTLIGTSVEKVDTGARLVQDAGSTMSEIIASVQRVTDLIGEITAAAAESLKDQAVRLAGGVSRFPLTGATA
jgi:hypothetical protein